MKIALYSDLHLECFEASWQPEPLDVDVVLLAGDIAKHTYGMAWAARTFSDWLSKPKVFYVAGNHEYYDANLGILDQLRQPKWKGVRLLERDVIELPSLRLLGCTLWSGFSLYGADAEAGCMAAAKRNINDYWMIGTSGGKRLNPEDTRRLHRKSVKWLDETLSKPFDGKTVVVTHFAPHPGCVAPQHQGSDVTPYFVTDLSGLMKKHSIDLWCHGHTHTNNDFMAENGCRVVANQRGYPREVASSGFRPDLVIDL